MAEHMEKGRQGEMLAADYLIGAGFRILERNWRSGHREIDIIALDGSMLVFVEVKTRKHIGNERLEEHFTRSKQENLIRSAGAYLEYRRLDLPVRFDVLLISGEPGEHRIEHVGDAFHAWD